jgi:hypothetical protein
MKAEEEELRKKYADLIKFGNEHPDSFQQTLAKLRTLTLLEGLPKQSSVLKEKKCLLEMKAIKHEEKESNNRRV